MTMKSPLVEIERTGSQDSDDIVSIVEETSSELKSFDGSPNRLLKGKTGFHRSKSPKPDHSIRSRSNVETVDKDRTGKISNRTRRRNDGESSTSPPTNNSDGNGNNGGNNDNPIEEIGATNRRAEIIGEIRHQCGVWVNNEKVQCTMVAFITINALMMGLATFDFVAEDEDLEKSFQIADDVFLWIFTIELVMQFIYLGFGLLHDGWLVFDLIIITISWWNRNLQVARGFRVFRIFRLVTRVKIMKDLILALFSVMPRMAAIFLMLLLIFYIFAVMFTMLFEKSKNEEIIIYFGSLHDSFLTLTQMMTMDEWATIVRVIQMDPGPGPDGDPDEQVNGVTATIFMVLFVVISGFIVVNLIVAVICDAIGALDEKDKAKFHGQHLDEDDSSKNLDLREQLDSIEDQIGDLTRIQARTFHTLEYLTQQLRVQKEMTRKGNASAAAKSTSSPFEDAPTEEPKKEPKKDRRSILRGDRARRRSMMGFTSKRHTYTDTWKQEGSEKMVRQDLISKFAKSARQLQKMREQEENADEDKNMTGVDSD